MESLVDALRSRARDPGPGTFRFLDAKEREATLGFPELWGRAGRLAGGLRAAGVRPGEVVALMLPTGPEFLVAWFGAMAAGAVPVALYPPVRLGRLDTFFATTLGLLESSGARVLLTEPRIRSLLGRVAERRVVPLGIRDARDVDGPPVAERPGPDDLAMIQFSSGTTVDPKPVALTHRQVLANAAAITGVVAAADPRPVGVSWLPLYHDMGLIGCVVPAVLAPGALTLIPPEVFLARPALWLRAVGRYRATISPAPNFAYAFAAERVRDEELDGVDLSSWTLALDGAEPVSAAACRRFVERFRRWGLPETAIVPVYGLSEMALAVTFADARAPLPVRRWSAEGLATGWAVADDDGVALVDVGRPLPGFEVAIRGPDRAPLAEGGIGRIWCRGPSRMAGYLGRDDAPFDGDWLDTGDLGFVADGRLTVTGRAKDVIVLRGRNHAPQDLERAVDGVSGVRAGCVAAVADVGAHGERLVILVEAREARAGLASDCVAALRDAAGVTPDEVVVLAPGTLPRTSSGKLRRGEALAAWRAGTLAPPGAAGTLGVATALARSALGHLRARW